MTWNEYADADEAAGKSWIPSPHQGSGTAWQPASVQGYEWMWMRGGWELMAHGVIFAGLQPARRAARRQGKAESVNVGMLMEQHQLGTGTILFRQMFSAESLTSPHPGISRTFSDWGDLSRRAAGRSSASAQRVCGTGDALHAAADGKSFVGILWRAIGRAGARASDLYASRFGVGIADGAAGHHLQDSTHTSFGVVTTGFVIDRVKLEASAFNGREPNEQRWSIQLAALDSWSGRAIIAPSANWTAQYSIGRLGASRSAGAGQPVAANCLGGIQPAAGGGQLGDYAVVGTRSQDRDGYHI